MFCPVVTIYATLGEEAIAHGINETEAETVVTSHELLPRLRRVLSRAPRVRRVVYMPDRLTATDCAGFASNVRVCSYSEVVSLGASSTIGECCN